MQTVAEKKKEKKGEKKRMKRVDPASTSSKTLFLSAHLRVSARALETVTIEGKVSGTNLKPKWTLFNRKAAQMALLMYIEKSEQEPRLRFDLTSVFFFSMFVGTMRPRG